MFVVITVFEPEGAMRDFRFRQMTIFVNPERFELPPTWLKTKRANHYTRDQYTFADNQGIQP